MKEMILSPILQIPLHVFSAGWNPRNLATIFMRTSVFGLWHRVEKWQDTVSDDHSTSILVSYRNTRRRHNTEDLDLDKFLFSYQHLLPF